MSIEKRIKSARKFAGFSQENLAKKLYITGRTLQRYEKDASKMPIEIAKNISFLCAVDLTWLLTGEGQMQEKEDADPNSKKYANTSRIILHKNKSSVPSSKLLLKNKDPYSSKKITHIAKDPYNSPKMSSIEKDPFLSGKIPEAVVNPTYLPVDIGLLEDIIAATEKYLFEHQLELSPSIKAELIVTLYEQFDVPGGGFEYKTFERFIRLITK